MLHRTVKWVSRMIFLKFVDSKTATSSRNHNVIGNWLHMKLLNGCMHISKKTDSSKTTFVDQSWRSFLRIATQIKFLRDMHIVLCKENSCFRGFPFSWKDLGGFPFSCKVLPSSLKKIHFGTLRAETNLFVQLSKIRIFYDFFDSTTIKNINISKSVSNYQYLVNIPFRCSNPTDGTTLTR